MCQSPSLTAYRSAHGVLIRVFQPRWPKEKLRPGKQCCVSCARGPRVWKLQARSGALQAYLLIYGVTVGLQEHLPTRKPCPELSSSLCNIGPTNRGESIDPLTQSVSDSAVVV